MMGALCAFAVPLFFDIFAFQYKMSQVSSEYPLLTWNRPFVQGCVHQDISLLSNSLLLLGFLSDIMRFLFHLFYTYIFFSCSENSDS